MPIARLGPLTVTREPFARAWPDMQPLAQGHHAEVSWPGDAPLALLADTYAEADEMGVLSVFVLRDGEGACVGYAWFWLYADPQHGGERRAQADAVFVHPAHRRGSTGLDFLRAVVDHLRAAEHCVTVTIGVRFARDFGPVLSRLGFQPVEVLWSCRTPVSRSEEPTT